MTEVCTKLYFSICVEEMGTESRCSLALKLEGTH